MTKIIRWDTPFTDSSYPSVGLMISPSVDLVRVLVSPFGPDAYPKYLVNFGNVVACTCLWEVCTPREFDPSLFEDRKLSAYEYLDSPWLKSYERGVDVFPDIPLRAVARPFRHYLIFGGDNNVEVITPNIPKVDRVEKKALHVIEVEI